MPDITFFRDPAVDRVLGVVMELAEEVYALRERVRVLQGGSPEADTAGRDAFVARILLPLTYEADSPDPAFEAP
jgi:hypothetical protein